MTKKNLILALAAALMVSTAFVACQKEDDPAQEEEQKDPEEGKKDPEEEEQKPDPVYEYYTGKLKSCDLPEEVGFNGGSYTATFETVETTKAEAEVIKEYVAWKYEVAVGGEVTCSETVSEELESVSFDVAPNYTKEDREVIFRVSPADADNWNTVASAKQASALTHPTLDGIGSWWAKGNLTVKDGKFVIAESMADYGLLFNAGSVYGVAAEQFSGKAYGPEEIELASLAGLPTEEGADPCKVMSTSFRLPSHADIWYLEAINYDDWSFDYVGELNGVKGIWYKDVNFFLPFAGYVNIGSGAYTGAGSYMSLLGLGEDIEGNNVVYVGNSDYTLIYYNVLGENLSSVRCVYDSKLPEYKSHTFSTGEASDKQMTLSVETDPGEYPVYEVFAISEDGYEAEGSATDNKTTAEIVIPANKTKETIEWTIFVNRMNTGVTFTQPAISDYAFYVSHSPASAEYGEFTLSVTVDTDMESVPVVVKGLSEDLTEYASANKTTVEFNIPENGEKESRTLSIYVNGQDTKKTVKQDGKPNEGGLSVEWAPGALTIKDGKYTFADSKERGMLFKFMSRYGIQVEGTYSSSSKYPGYAYGPDKVTKTYEELTTDDVDPCSLVLPAGTWRLPTGAEYTELSELENGSTFSESAYSSKNINGTDFVFVGAGQMNDTGTGISLPAVSVNWTSTPGTTSGQYVYMMWSMSSASKNFSLSNGGAKKTKAMQVRCVRNK